MDAEKTYLAAEFFKQPWNMKYSATEVFTGLETIKTVCTID